LKPTQSGPHRPQAFDSYCKKVLKYAARDYGRKKQRQGQREISLLELPDREKAVMDQYFTDSTFEVLGKRVNVTDYELAQALSQIPANKREIVLLSYFLDMPDREIAAFLDMARSTVAYRRTSSLKELKKILEESDHE